MKALMLVLSLFLVGCAYFEDDEKDLFSLWTDRDTGDLLDLRGMSFNMTKQVTLTFTDNTVCTCDAWFSGTQHNGNAAFSNCLFVSGEPLATTICADSEFNGTYSKLSSIDYLSLLEEDINGNYIFYRQYK